MSTTHAAARLPSLSRMVGQMVMAGMTGTTPSADLLARVRDGQVGGIIIFTANIDSDAGIHDAITALQGAAAKGANPPLLISVDQEGGTIRRFPAAPPISPRLMSTEREAFTQGSQTGRFLKGEGVNVDFAPVADVASAPNAFEAIQGRGFNGPSDRVAQLAKSFAAGLQQERVAACAKHFPGIGSLTTDTDNQLGRISLDASQLDDSLRPFTALIRGGVHMVMVANAIYPALDPNAPAGFSSRIINGLLRGQLGFRGVVITDALDSPSDLPGASPAERAVEAVRAGADIVLFSPEESGPEAYTAIVGAAQNSDISRARITAAYDRIVALKRAVAS